MFRQTAHNPGIVRHAVPAMVITLALLLGGTAVLAESPQSSLLFTVGIAAEPVFGVSAYLRMAAEDPAAQDQLMANPAGWLEESANLIFDPAVFNVQVYDFTLPAVVEIGEESLLWYAVGRPGGELDAFIGTSRGIGVISANYGLYLRELSPAVPAGSSAHDGGAIPQARFIQSFADDDLAAIETVLRGLDAGDLDINAALASPRQFLYQNGVSREVLSDVEVWVVDLQRAQEAGGFVEIPQAPGFVVEAWSGIVVFGTVIAEDGTELTLMLSVRAVF